MQSGMFNRRCSACTTSLVTEVHGPLATHTHWHLGYNRRLESMRSPHTTQLHQHA